MRHQLHRMRDIELQKIADHAHEKPILQSEARKELFARHQEDLERQEERRKELETDMDDLDPALPREPPAPASAVKEPQGTDAEETNNDIFDEINNVSVGVCMNCERSFEDVYKEMEGIYGALCYWCVWYDDNVDNNIVGPDSVTDIM